MISQKLSIFFVCAVATHSFGAAPALVGDGEKERDRAEGYEQRLKHRDEHVEKLKKENDALQAKIDHQRKVENIDQARAFGFIWKKFDPVLPSNSATDMIPSSMSLSSYSYPTKYYGNVSTTLGYLSCATMFSIGLELREMRREMMKRGEYWDFNKIKLAVRSSLGRRAATMGIAFPIFVYTLDNVKKFMMEQQQNKDDSIVK